MIKKRKTIIHVNRQYIAFNAKVGKPVLPTYIVRQGSKITYCHAFKVLGPLESADPRVRPQLKCGARAWLETEHEVEFTDPMTFNEARILKEEYLERHNA